MANEYNAYYGGDLDDMRVYDDALSESEIQKIFQGDDLKEELVHIQFSIDATQSPTSYGVSHLPNGLTVDPLVGEITGKPLEIGVFDLNLTATNLAGTGVKQIKLVIDPTAPTLTTTSPKDACLPPLSGFRVAWKTMVGIPLPCLFLGRQRRRRKPVGGFQRFNPLGPPNRFERNSLQRVGFSFTQWLAEECHLLLPLVRR